MKAATISGSTLTVTENGSSQVLTYNLINAPPSTDAFNISGSEIQLLPALAVANPIVTGSSGPVSETTATQLTYVISSSAMISGSGTDNFTSTDTTPGDFLTVEIDQGASISVTGTSNVGVNLTTSVDNIALISAGTINAAGGKGINTSSGGTGTTVIVDNGNVTGSTTGIAAATNSGSLNIVLGYGVTVTGTATFGISAISMSGVIDINTSPGDIITSGSIGINAQDQGSSVPQSDDSAITIVTNGTINSGNTQSTRPASRQESKSAIVEGQVRRTRPCSAASPLTITQISPPPGEAGYLSTTMVWATFQSPTARAARHSDHSHRGRHHSRKLCPVRNRCVRI